MSLSQRELDLITKIGECMDEYRQILEEDGPTWEEIQCGLGFQLSTARDGDINEFSSAVHIMQRMVMARCAQRSYPDYFTRQPAPVVEAKDHPVIISCDYCSGDGHTVDICPQLDC